MKKFLGNKRILSYFYIFSILVLLPSCSLQPSRTADVTSANDAATTCHHNGNRNSDTAKVLLDPNHINLLSWNIFKGKINGWKKDLQKLSKNKSIVLIQEAPLNALKTTLSSRLDNQKKWFWQFSPGYKTSNEQTGVMAVATTQATIYCYLAHKEPWLRSPKATLVTTYGIAGSEKTLMVAAIHSINFTIGTKAYREQLEDLRAIISQHDGPLIVAGDFNSWSKERNRIIEETFYDLQLKKADIDPTFEKKFFGYPLDHVFFRGLEMKSSNVYPLTSSDHNPIQVDFKLQYL